MRLSAESTLEAMRIQGSLKKAFYEIKLK